MFSPERVDTAFIDRLLSKCTDHLSLLAAPATLDKVYDFGADAFDSIFDVLRLTVPCIVLDVPHLWTGWTKARPARPGRRILIVARAGSRQPAQHQEPVRPPADVAAERPPPLYCLNQVGVPKRPEIQAGDFAKALETEPDRHDPVRAADLRHRRQQRPDDRRGRRRAHRGRDVPQLAQALTGRAEAKKPPVGLLRR